jgi:hypothetical protein
LNFARTFAQGVDPTLRGSERSSACCCDTIQARRTAARTFAAITSAPAKDRSILAFLRELNIDCHLSLSAPHVRSMDSSTNAAEPKQTPMAPSKRKMLDAPATATDDDDDDMTVNSSIVTTKPLGSNQAATSASLFNDSDSDDLCILNSSSSKTTSPAASQNVNDTAPSKAAAPKRRKTTAASPRPSASSSAAPAPGAPKKAPAPAKPSLKAVRTGSPDAPDPKGHELQLDAPIAGMVSISAVRLASPQVSPFKKLKPIAAAKAKPSASVAAKHDQAATNEREATNQSITTAIAFMLDTFAKTSQGCMDLVRTQIDSQTAASQKFRDELVKGYTDAKTVMAQMQQAKLEMQAQFESNSKLCHKMQQIYEACCELQQQQTAEE